MLQPVAPVRYVFVDLDGTLVRSDLLIESAWRYLRQRPLGIFVLLRLLIRGRSVLKAYLARHVPIDPGALPYEEGILAYLRARKAEGCRIVLATASHWKPARRIAAHHGLFDAVVGSSARRNLKGARKLATIRAESQGLPFTYAGDSFADRPIWNAADRVVFVNAPKRDVRAAERAGRADLSLRTRPGLTRAFLKEMRLHQWAKNALLFVPVLTAHTYGNVGVLLAAVVAFLAFGLCASGHYFANDLLDLDSDRAHRTKAKRPLASGDLPLAYGVMGAIALPAAGFALALSALPPRFAAVLLGYFALTNAYSFYLKRVSTADVMALALLYTLRVIAGAAATAIILSSWLLAFSMFIFLSLAYLKRYIEVAPLARSIDQAKGRGYSGADSETMFVLGIANATAAVVVLAFYISSMEVVALYREPEILWGLCLLVLYWTNRMWIGARREKIDDDPLVFALKDRVSRITAVFMIAVVMAARFLP